MARCNECFHEQACLRWKIRGENVCMHFDNSDTLDCSEFCNRNCEPYNFTMNEDVEHLMREYAAYKARTERIIDQLTAQLLEHIDEISKIYAKGK